MTIGKQGRRFCLQFFSALLIIQATNLMAAVEEELEEIIVYSTRIEKSIYDTPSAVSVVTRDDIQLGRQQLGLDESLVKVPGVFMQDRYNYAQDLRIAIRGFGSRATFGIRGIRMFVDGIPATLPDGQSGVDSIDIGSIDRIEVIRGPSSSLYGSAAGGVISIYTEDGPEIPFIEAQYAGGQDDFQKYQLKAGGQYESLNYLVNLSRLDYEGYREQSHTKNFSLNTRLKYNFDETSDFTTIINISNTPVANDAGGLTALEAATKPKMARVSNVIFDAGEDITQQSAGFVYRKEIASHHEIRLNNYYVWRNFENRLAFANGGNVQFDRFFVGGGLTYTYDGDLFGHANDLVLGFDVNAQEDDRQRYMNNLGIVGALTFDQIESVDSLGAFLQDDLQLSDQVVLSFSVRYDEVDFEVADKFMSNGDDSGVLSFDNFNPMVALLWQPMDYLNLYAKYSTSFETPTTTELANPNGSGGFNPDLLPQLATNYEVGAKGQLPNSLSYELALFHIDVEDELIRFGLPAFPGRDFFRNAGQSTRQGLEAAIAFMPIQHLTVSANYTYSDFEYDDYSTTAGVFDGNAIPGLPPHQAYAELNYQHPSGFYVVWDLLWTDEIFANDANTRIDDDSTVSNVRAGYKGEWGKWNISPFVGLNNITNNSYNTNIRINDPVNRFYEPAPEFNVYTGLSIRYRFE